MTRIAIRCDGGQAIGAGHVGRCVPVALALRDRGSEVVFVGAFDGVAAWLLQRAAFEIRPPGDRPCGLRASDWTGAVVDLYLSDGEQEVCALAGELPVATLGEATRCTTSGIWVDYHVGSPDEAGPRRLGGPAYAPLDPRFAAARRGRPDVERILVSAGASTMFGDLPPRMADAAAAAFPDAEVVAPRAVAAAATRAVTPLASPFDLAELASSIDLAVVGAGMTTYELACAGVPTVAVGLVENQRIVIDGCRTTGIALAVDGVSGDPIPAVAAALDTLHDRVSREALSRAGARTVDGRGADRIANALLAAWTDRGAAPADG